MPEILVMPGSSQMDLPLVQSIAQEFGFGVKVAENLSSAPDATAVLLYRDALGACYSWMEAIQQIRQALPQSHIVTCLGFSEPIDWQQLSDAGAFHALWLPLKENEVRQSLGFLSASLSKRGPAASGSE
jgi:hypothetical protein